MAKSIRSKRKRKMRAVKREKGSVKEMARLIKLAAKDGELVKLVTDAPMRDMQAGEDKGLEKNTAEGDAGVSGDTMDVDAKLYNKKTKRDQNGDYPAWMNRRAIKKQKGIIQKAKAKKKRKLL